MRNIKGTCNKDYINILARACVCVCVHARACVRVQVRACAPVYPLVQEQESDETEVYAKRDFLIF